MIIFFSIFLVQFLASKYQMFALREFERFLLLHCGLGLTRDDGPSPVSAQFPTNTACQAFPIPLLHSPVCNEKLEQHRGLPRVRASLEDKIGQAAAKVTLLQGAQPRFWCGSEPHSPWPGGDVTQFHTMGGRSHWGFQLMVMSCRISPTDLVVLSLFNVLKLMSSPMPLPLSLFTTF